MSTIMRTLRNIRKIGIKEYAHQMQYIGDTKAGTYIATDKYGNKYYENLEQELPCTPPHPPFLRLRAASQAADSLPLGRSTNAMGRLQAERIRSGPDRTGLACMDVLSGGQAAD